MQNKIKQRVHFAKCFLTEKKKKKEWIQVHRSIAIKVQYIFENSKRISYGC